MAMTSRHNQKIAARCRRASRGAPRCQAPGEPSPGRQCQRPADRRRELRGKRGIAGAC